MRALSCIGPHAKSTLAEEIGRSALDEAEKAGLNQFLKTFPTCGTGIPIEIGEIQTGKKGKRAKRAPSTYNLFIKKCFGLSDVKLLGSAPEKMRACGTKWKQEKAT